MEELICLREERIHKGHDRRYAEAKNCKNDDELFLSIADGDFAFPKEIRDKVSEVVKSGNMAYEFLEQENSKHIIKSYKERYGVAIKEDDIIFGNGVLYWLQIAVHVLTNSGEGVIIQPPVYDTFAKIIKNADRKVINAPLKEKNGKFSMDFKKLEEAFKVGRIFILCSPHNPTGNVWTKKELLEVMRLAKKYNVYVISDEIWQDVVFSKTFTSILELDEYMENIIHVSSPAKTFNLGGLQFGVAIIKDKKLNEVMRRYAESIIEYSSSQIWVSKAIQIAYTNKKTWEWFKTYLAQIKKNKTKLAKLFKAHKVDFSNPEGTYLLFAKLGNKKYKGQSLLKKMKKVGLHTGMGFIYGEEYSEWIRLNIAICDNSMELLLHKLEVLIKDLKK